MCLQSRFSRVHLFATPWTVTHQAPLSTGFPSLGYQSGQPFSSPGNRPDPGLKRGSPALQADSLPLSHWVSPLTSLPCFFIFFPCFLALFFNFYFVLEYSWAQVAIVVKNSLANARHKRREFDPWVRNIPCRGEHGNPLQNSCLKNPMGRGDWQAMVQGPQRVGHNWSNLARIVD